MKLWFLVATIFLSTAFAANRFEAIPYYPDGTSPQPDKNLLDVFVPTLGANNAPVFFFVHGGSWQSGDRTEYEALGHIMADEENMVTVIISYRLSDEAHATVTHPDHITDVAQAFRWTVDHIAEYGGDPRKIFVAGHSAGAHLATLLATNTRFLENVGCTDDQIRGVISFSMGMYDLPALDSVAGIYAPYVMEYGGFYRVFGRDSLTWADASPRYHLHTGMPPFALFVADSDMVHIIGGTMYTLRLPGEINAAYNHFNAFQPTDSFWFRADHSTILSDFAYYPTSRQRTIAMSFIDAALVKIGESPMPRQQKLHIFPNPFNSAVQIDAPADAKVRITEITGKLVFEANGATRWIPNSSVATGVYFAHVASSSGTTCRKLIYLK